MALLSESQLNLSNRGSCDEGECHLFLLAYSSPVFLINILQKLGMKG